MSLMTVEVSENRFFYLIGRLKNSYKIKQNRIIELDNDILSL